MSPARRGGCLEIRCNGQLRRRDGTGGRCRAKAIKGTEIEPLVWADAERFLRDPGDIMQELSVPQERERAAGVIEAERPTLRKALDGVVSERKNATHLRLRGSTTDEELDELHREIERRRRVITERVAGLEVPEPSDTEKPPDLDLLTQLRGYLDAGLIDKQRQAVVQELVKGITVDTEEKEGRKGVRSTVEYRFANSVDPIIMGTRSIAVYESLQAARVLTVDDTLTGGSGLPGFSCSVRDIL